MPVDSVIMEARPCRKCGYDLKGLRVGGKCPECGEPIRARKKSFGPREGTMSDAPPAYVKRVGLGFTLMSVGIILSLLGVPIGCFVPYGLLGAILLGSLFWIAGGWIITGPRPAEFREVHNPIMDNPRWRTGVRVAAAMWPGFLLLTGLAIATQSMGVLGTVLLILAGIIGLLSLAGMIPISIYIAEIEFWMSDDTGGWQLRGAAWVLLVFGAAFLIASVTFKFVAVLCGVVLFATAAVLARHIIGCASRARWILRYQDQNEGRVERITERLRDRSERGGTVAGSMPCPECGYELRGLPHGGNCPECGHSYAHLTPMPIRDPAKSPRRDDSPIAIDDTGPTQTIRPRDPVFGRRPEPVDDSPIPLAGDDLPEDLQDLPPTPRPDDDGPIPLADDEPRRP